MTKDATLREVIETLSSKNVHRVWITETDSTQRGQRPLGQCAVCDVIAVLREFLDCEGKDDTQRPSLSPSLSTSLSVDRVTSEERDHTPIVTSLSGSVPSASIKPLSASLSVSPQLVPLSTPSTDTKSHTQSQTGQTGTQTGTQSKSTPSLLQLPSPQVQFNPVTRRRSVDRRTPSLSSSLSLSASAGSVSSRPSAVPSIQADGDFIAIGDQYVLPVCFPLVAHSRTFTQHTGQTLHCKSMRGWAVASVVLRARFATLVWLRTRRQMENSRFFRVFVFLVVFSCFSCVFRCCFRVFSCFSCVLCCVFAVVLNGTVCAVQIVNVEAFVFEADL